MNSVSEGLRLGVIAMLAWQERWRTCRADAVAGVRRAGEGEGEEEKRGRGRSVAHTFGMNTMTAEWTYGILCIRVQERLRSSSS